jgi:hypothetical protein
MTTLTFDGKEYLDGIASDPNILGWMRGSPPAPDRLITFQDDRFLSFPRHRWALSHVSELLSVAPVARRADRVSLLAPATETHTTAFEALRFKSRDGQDTSWLKALSDTYTDGIAVLHRGRLVYERYFGALEPDRRHLSFSLTKSYASTLAATLIHQGALDEQWRIPHVIPELAATAYGNATIRQLLDMEVAVSYSEDYDDPGAEVWQYARAAGMRSIPHGYQGPTSLYAFLCRLQGAGRHGELFDYKTPNTEVLAWLMQRVTGVPFATLLSERLWQPLGCEHDGHIIVDATGVAVAGAGLSVTLRDLLRFGELMRTDGAIGRQQVIPAAVVANIRRGGNRANFARADYPLLPGYSYRDMWWITHNQDQAFEGRGIHGQRLFVSPGAELVIGRLASHPIGTSAANEPITQPLIHAATELVRTLL